MINYIAAYYRFGQLSEAGKIANGIKSPNRLECLSFTDKVPGGYKGLEPFKNKKGQLYIYKAPARSMITANSKRVPEWVLTHGSLNVTSIYIEAPGFGYGYPCPNPYLPNGSKNPLFDYRADGYLFNIDSNLSVIELFIISNGKNMISSYYSQLIDGELNNEIEQLRKEAKPFYDYLPPVSA